MLWNPYQGTVYDIVSSREIPIERTATATYDLRGASATSGSHNKLQEEASAYSKERLSYYIVSTASSARFSLHFAVMAVSRKTRGKSINAPRNKIENAVNKMTPEIYFARKLASNEKKIRDRSLKKLRRWIAARSAVPDGISTWCLFAFINVF